MIKIQYEYLILLLLTCEITNGKKMKLKEL